MLSVQDERIICREQLPFAMRVGTGLLGLLCCGIFLSQLLLQMHRDMTASELQMTAMALLLVGSVGVFFLRAALVSPMELVLDPVSDQVHRLRRGHGQAVRRDAFALRELSAPQVMMREGATSPQLRLRLPKGRAFVATGFHNQGDAELWRDRIAAVIAAAS